MREELFKAVLELVEASVERDFTFDPPSYVEERVFDAVRAVLDLLGKDPDPQIREWARTQREKEYLSFEAT